MGDSVPLVLPVGMWKQGAAEPREAPGKGSPLHARPLWGSRGCRGLLPSGVGLRAEPGCLWAVPGPVGHLSFSDILDTSLKVSWQEPLEKNGILTGKGVPTGIQLPQHLPPHSISHPAAFSPRSPSHPAASPTRRHLPPRGISPGPTQPLGVGNDGG